MQGNTHCLVSVHSQYMVGPDLFYITVTSLQFANFTQPYDGDVPGLVIILIINKHCNLWYAIWLFCFMIILFHECPYKLLSG